MIEADLVATLKATAAITNIVGERVFPCHIPQTATLPAVSMFVVSKPGQHNLEGPSFGQARIQLDCWSTVYSEAIELVEAIRTLLDGYQGTLGTTYIGECSLDNELHTFEPSSGTDQGIYHTAVDFLILYNL